jgi:hypothetical protein
VQFCVTPAFIVRDSGKKYGAVGVISGSERRSIKVMCLLISCFIKMRKYFVSLTYVHAHGHARAHTHARTHTHTLQTPECVAVILLTRQPDNTQSAKQFTCEIFLCHVYRRKSKIIRYFSCWPDELVSVLLRSKPAPLTAFQTCPVYWMSQGYLHLVFRTSP